MTDWESETQKGDQPRGIKPGLSWESKLRLPGSRSWCSSTAVRNPKHRHRSDCLQEEESLESKRK